MNALVPSAVSDPAPPPRTPVPAQVRAQSLALGVPSDYGRTRGLRRQREPGTLAHIGRDINDRDQWLVPRAAGAYRHMIQVAAAAGVPILLVSGFRSAQYQLEILKRKLARGQRIDEILQVIAAPGYSEHHTGRAVDLTAPGIAPAEEAFEHSSAFAWLQVHSARFGFRMSYPRGNPHGILYEPWHWCFRRSL